MLQQRIKGLVVAHMTGRRLRDGSPLPAPIQMATVSALRTLAALPDGAR